MTLRPFFILSFGKICLNFFLFFFPRNQASEEKEIEIAESRPFYHMVRRFVESKEFESPFALRLLSKTLNEVLKNLKIEEPLQEKPEKFEKPEKEEAVADSQQEMAMSWEDEEGLDASFQSNGSSTTVLYSFDDSAELRKSKVTNLDRSSRKNRFFSSYSDSSTSTTSESVGKVRKKKRKNIKRKKEKEKKKLEESDKENKELEKLLKMTETNMWSVKNQNSSPAKENGNPKIRLKISKNSEKLGLLDCLDEGEVSGEEAAAEPEIDKENEEVFFRTLNDEVKNSFLVSTTDSKSESEVEAKVDKKKKIVKSRKSSKVKLRQISDNEMESEESEKYSTETMSSSEISEDAEEKKPKEEPEIDILLSSSDSCCEVEQVVNKTQSSPIKGRKNINKIIKKECLQEETKQALKTETERKKRLSERQKLFDEFYPNSKKNSKLVLDFDLESKKELIVVDEILSRNLKPHQKEGVRFMWNNCFESVERLKEEGSGCILAHCMGLGKTLQIITLIHTVLTHKTGVRNVLVVCPLNTIQNCVGEFKFWLKNCEKKISVFSLLQFKTQTKRASNVRTWMREGGVMVVSYSMLRTLTQQKVNSTFSSGFLDPGPHLVICDEGHFLKNENSNLSKCLNRIKTLRRIVLTGTPLQNNLIEYYCMVHFVKPNILGTRQEFMNRFVNPINNGQFEDSTQMDVRIMKRRAHVLHTMLDGFIQRYDYNVLTQFLPKKQEYVISIALTESQCNLYRTFIEGCLKQSRGLFKDFHWLQKVWTHPLVMLKYSEKFRDEAENKNGRPVEREEWKHPFWEKFVKETEYEDFNSSGKLLLLFFILKKCKEIGDKVLVFSQSLDSLDLIEHFLRKAHHLYKNNSSSPFADSWAVDVDYCRMDGSTSSEVRDAYCKKFNNSKDKRLRLFLISTRAGGVGINLVGANRVVLFDASWNPSHDVQCIFRVYRFGQKKACFIYRFLAAATMEEKIYKRQVNKLSLAHRILDEHQIERHYTMGNLQELYIFEPLPKKDWKAYKLPKDNLFAEMLVCYKNIIVGYHEHDSLLENKEEEELTEEERRAAWEEYEKEKTSQPENPINMPARMSLIEKLNYDALRVVHTYKQGLIPEVAGKGTQTSGIPFHEASNQLCKIVDVRTLHVPNPGEKGAGPEKLKLTTA